jgi:uncharacterized protein
MKMNEDLGGGYVIDAYAAGSVSINERRYTRSLVVSPSDLDPDWPPQRLEELEVEHMQALLALEPEIVILGTGERLRFPPPELRRVFAERGIGLEVMDTAAACRTYNIIALEGRRVAAGLMMIA